MIRIRPLLHVLLAIVMITTGFIASVAHAQPGHTHGLTPSAVAALTAGNDTAVAMDPGAVTDDDHRTDPGKVHTSCCACPSSTFQVNPAVPPMRIAHLTSLVARPADPGHPDALSEALPRPPRTFA